MNKLTTSFTAIALAATFGLATVAPASADQAAATRNEILGGLALVAGIATAVNVSHKNAQANTISGYTPNGDAVYADGHVITQNGQSYYPGNNGQNVSCSGGQCQIGWNGNSGYQQQYGRRNGYR